MISRAFDASQSEFTCTDPVLRAGHGKAGLAAAQAFDWDAINGAVLNRYRDLIATKNP